MKNIITYLFGLIIILFLVGCQPVVECEKCLEPIECEDCSEPIECDLCEESQISNNVAIVDTLTLNYGYWIENDKIIIFDYWLLNYGNSEAKNINVNCKLLDENYQLVIEKTEFFGNLASNSAVHSEHYSDETTNVNIKNLYISVCRIESCDNCDILYKRIPDLSWSNIVE